MQENEKFMMLCRALFEKIMQSSIDLDSTKQETTMMMEEHEKLKVRVLEVYKKCDSIKERF